MAVRARRVSPDPNHAGLPGRYGYRRMGAAYQGAMEAVFAIVVATAAGYWADGYFGTSPWCVLSGATIGFAAFVLRLYRLGTALNPPSSEPGSSVCGEEGTTQPGDLRERPAGIERGRDGSNGT